MDKTQYQIVVEFSTFSFMKQARVTAYELRDVTAASEDQAKRIAEKRVLKSDRYRSPEIIRSEVLCGAEVF